MNNYGTIDKLDEESRHRVKALNLKFIAEGGVEGVQANVIYAIARKE